MAVATDDFDRADGALTAPWTQSVPGGNNDLVISSNELMCEHVSSYAMARHAGTFADDQYAQAVITTAGTGVGAAVRINAAADRQGYLAFVAFGDTNISVINGSGGPFANIIAASGTGSVWQVGDVFRIEAEGTTIRVMRNGVELLSVSDATSQVAKSARSCTRTPPAWTIGRAGISRRQRAGPSPSAMAASRSWLCPAAATCGRPS